MADRLTQLQDCINQVSRVFCDFLSIIIQMTVYFSKPNISATVLVYYNNMLRQVSFQGSTEVDHKLLISNKPRMTMCNCLLL